MPMPPMPKLPPVRVNLIIFATLLTGIVALAMIHLPSEAAHIISVAVGFIGGVMTRLADKD